MTSADKRLNKIAIAENANGVCYVAMGFTEKEAKENCILAVCRGEKIAYSRYHTAGSPGLHPCHRSIEAGQGCGASGYLQYEY